MVESEENCSDLLMNLTVSRWIHESDNFTFVNGSDYLWCHVEISFVHPTEMSTTSMFLTETLPDFHKD